MRFAPLLLFVVACSLYHTVTAATTESVVKSIDPSSISAGVSSTITFAGTINDKDFVSIVAALDPCTSSNIAVSSSTATVSSQVVGDFAVCYRSYPETDSVKQTTKAAQLVVVAATLANVVTDLTPDAKPTVSTEVTVTMTGDSVIGDLVTFTTETTCVTAIPDIAVEVASTATSKFTPRAAGKYFMCYRSVGGNDAVKQTSIELSVLAATLADVVTNITSVPTKPTAGAKVTVTLTGTSSTGSLVAFTKKGACTSETPNVSVPTGTTVTVEFTPESAGTYIMCYRSPGRSDAVEQTEIKLVVGPKAKQTSGVARVPVNWISGWALVIGLPFASAHRL